jgi:hypothetical protein
MASMGDDVHWQGQERAVKGGGRMTERRKRRIGGEA